VDGLRRLLRWYRQYLPPENADLQNSLAECLLLTNADLCRGRHFRSNRIISGMSRAIVVVEAALR
jgi:predicted Rossmann fold nucleotide-binding protein DprA/Smf involved in DNA uptake